MKCAVAIVLALIGMSIANPVPPIGLTSLVSTSYVPVSVSSSVVNHGVSLPLHIPVVKSVHLPVWTVGWGKYWH